MEPVRLVGVTIAPEPKEWDLSIPLVSWQTPKRDLPRENQFTNPERVNFLAEHRNKATEKALQDYPEATHIFNVESYYLPQTISLLQLAMDYERLNIDAILGAGTWAVFEQADSIRVIYYDKWATPEWRELPGFGEASGLRPVSSVGSVFIFPIAVWKEGVRFENSGFPSRFYYNNFCFNSKRMVMLDFDAKFYRTWRDSDIPPPEKEMTAK